MRVDDEDDDDAAAMTAVPCTVSGERKCSPLPS